VTIAVSTLVACGDDGDTPTPDGTVTEPTGAAGPTGDPATGGAPANNGSGTTGVTGNGPQSAGDRNPDAPDSGISDRPGGPDESNASQNDGG
jgi:hypothetical protein